MLERSVVFNPTLTGRLFETCVNCEGVFLLTFFAILTLISCVQQLADFHFFDHLFTNKSHCCLNQYYF